MRHQSRPPRAGGCIEFVTTGVLLRRLVAEPLLEGISHVMIDEVHERDINTDFLLILLRDLLTKRPELRLILMSATLDASSFQEYFSYSIDSPVPVMSVPTKPRHHVDVIYLDDIAYDGEALSPSSSTESSNEFPSDIQDFSQSLLRLHDQQFQLELEEAVAEERAAVTLAARSLAEDEGEISFGDDENFDSDSDTDNSNWD